MVKGTETAAPAQNVEPEIAPVVIEVNTVTVTADELAVQPVIGLIAVAI